MNKSALAPENILETPSFEKKIPTLDQIIQYQNAFFSAIADYFYTQGRKRQHLEETSHAN